MAYYRRRYRRYRPRRYIRRYFRRRFRRFINGSSKSMVRLKVPVHSTYGLQQAANQQGTPVAVVGAPFVDSTYTLNSPLASPLYRTYCSLYDEVKCIGFKANINVSSAVGGSDIPSLQILTAIDRRFGYGEAIPSFSDMKVYSTYSMATAVNNSVAKLVRSCYASDLLEKAQWHDCSLSVAAGVYSDDAYHAAGANPNFFCPTLFICFAVPQILAATQINFTADVTYYFAFRNPKFGGSAAATKDVVDVMDKVPDSRGPAGGDDMDDGHYANIPLPDDDDLDLEEEAAAAVSAAPGGLTRPQRSLGINPKKSARVVRIADRGGKN